MSKFILLGLDGACPGIIEKATDEGLLPNFRRLREVGCSAENIPFPAAVTPGNWTSIATGAKPATTGISDFAMHAPGAPLDEKHEVFTTHHNNRAQFVWDAYSERGLKVATISFPGTLPRTHPLHLAIGNEGMPGENAPPHTIARSRGLVAGNIHPTGPYGWQEHEALELRPATDGPGLPGFEAKWAADFTIRPTNRGHAGEHAMRLCLGRAGGGDAAVIVDKGRPILLRKREWTPLFAREFTRKGEELRYYLPQEPAESAETGEFRLRIAEMDAERGDLLLYISSVYPREAFASDRAVASALRRELGPYADSLGISRLVMGWLDDEGFCDEFRAQVIWQARAALKLVNEMGYSGVLSKWHAFDKFYHFFMQKIEPAAPGFDPQQFERYEGLHRRLLSFADEAVGILLDGMDADTSLVVVSDHGLMASRRWLWVNRYLAQNGYITYTKDADGRVHVDWSRTRAYVSAFLILNANLRGREPDGIVEPGQQYEELKRELIELLRGWKDPETGQHVMSDVFDPRADGAFYGLGSEMDGDVRYFAAPGYSVYRATAVGGGEAITDIHGPYLGDHGSCRPTARFGRGGEPGIFYAAGHGFRRGYRRPRPVFPCDVMPTLLHIAAQPPLAQQEGAVLYDILER